MVVLRCAMQLNLISFLLLVLALPGETADGGWVDLFPADKPLEPWETPTGDWQVVGSVALDPDKPRTLVSKPGQGVLFNGPKSTRNLISKQKFTDVEAHVEFNARNRPCGFLDQASGCCRIYPVRPIACRYFFSLDPPEMCTPTHEMYLKRRTRTVHLPEEMHELLMKVGHRLGFRPLNYLSGAFCGFTAEVMHSRQVRVSS